MAPQLQPEFFTDADVLWFIDNQASVTAVVKGCRSEGDVHEIAHLAAVERCSLRTRTWYEWIDSDSNPADGLSRLGLLDAWMLQQGWSLQEYAFPATAFRDAIVSALLAPVTSETVGVRYLETLGVSDPYRDL